MEVLDSLGVVDQILARGYPVHGVSVRRGGHELFRFEMKLDQGGHPAPRPDQPYRSAMLVNQAEVEGVLREKLAALGGQVERQRELRSFEETPGRLVAQVAGPAPEEVEQVAAKWLVGCDGAHSSVRQLLQLPMEGEEYPEQLVLADVHLQGDLPQGVTIMWLNIEFALRRGSELDINYRSSPLSEQHDHVSSGPEAGDRAPDGQLLDRSEQSTSVFAHFRTPHFRLLLFQGLSSPADVADLALLGQRLQDASGGLVRACLIVGPQDATHVTADDLTLLRDPEHGTHMTYGASSSCLYLVRPDGYVGFRSRTADESKLIDYLRRNFAMGYMA